MQNITIKYIIYTAGHRRHHAGAQANLIPVANGRATSGDTINTFAFGSLPYQGTNLPFAFMSVNGAADGNHLYTAPGNYTVEVGSTDVNIVVVYATAGGGPGGGSPGVTIDAFIVDLGDFSDSDFVQVITDGTLDKALTKEANDNGDVPTQNAELLRTYETVDGVPFSQWKKIGGPSGFKRDFQLALQETGFAFAFYQTAPTRPAMRPDTSEGIWQWVDPGTMVDDGIHPWNPDFRHLLAGIVMADLAGSFNQSLTAEVLDLAAKQVSVASAGIVKAMKQQSKKGGK
jgi:hypothetical protein